MAKGEKPSGSGSKSPKPKKKLLNTKELKNTSVQQQIIGGRRGDPASAERCTEMGCEQSDFCKTAGCP